MKHSNLLAFGVLDSPTQENLGKNKEEMFV
jgi:hypothetical protein